MMGKIISYVLTSILLAGYSSFVLAGAFTDPGVIVCATCPIPTISAVEPETLLLLGLGIAALAVVQRWRRRK
jgi:hypothetical protein